MSRLLLALLPWRLRESIAGDLAEELPRDGLLQTDLVRLFAVAVIVGHFQLEPYRHPAGRRDVLQVLAAAIMLILAIHATAWNATTVPIDYDPLSRLLLAFWAAPHITGALAAGLLTGRMEGPGPADLAPHRLHAAVTLAGLLAVVAPTPAAGLLAGCTCVAAAALGAAARRDAICP